MSHLATGTWGVPPGMVAAVVTYFEMEAPPGPPPGAPEGVTLKREDNPGTEWYISLFHAIGDPWLWQARLRLGRAGIAELLRREGYELWVPWRDGRAIGLAELSRAGNVAKVEYFGLLPGETGGGLGRWLMGEMQARAFGTGAAKLILNTCTLDSPFAISFYQRMGFRAVRRAVDVFPDPRIDGLLPPDAGGHIPLLA